jgi:hypothetical protein
MLRWSPRHADTEGRARWPLACPCPSQQPGGAMQRISSRLNGWPCGARGRRWRSSWRSSRRGQGRWGRNSLIVQLSAGVTQKAFVLLVCQGAGAEGVRRAGQAPRRRPAGPSSQSADSAGQRRGRPDERPDWSLGGPGSRRKVAACDRRGGARRTNTRSSTASPAPVGLMGAGNVRGHGKSPDAR